MKIYYKNEWIDVEIGDPKLEELNIRIGDGVVIDSCVRLGNCVRLGDGVWLGDDVWLGNCVVIGIYSIIPKNTVIPGKSIINSVIIHDPKYKYKVVLCNGNIAIGCQIHTPEEWQTEGDKIAKKNNITDDDKAWYKEQIEFLKDRKSVV